MTEHSARSLRRIYGLALSAILILTGICLMVQCCRIYYTGDGTFSPEIVAAHFSPIAIPVYLCLAMVVLGFVLEAGLPAGKGRKAVDKNYELILEKLHGKTDLSACGEDLQAKVAQEQQAR